MTSHELAKLLLDMPDLPVVSEDGMSPSDYQEITAKNIKLREIRYYSADGWQQQKVIAV